MRSSCGLMLVLPCGQSRAPLRSANACISRILWRNAASRSKATGIIRSPASRPSPSLPISSGARPSAAGGSPLVRQSSLCPIIDEAEASGVALRGNDAAADLVELDRLEQGLEIALAEALIALALDDLEEDRADHVFGKDLEQQAPAGLGRAVDQDTALAHRADVVAVARQALVDHVVIGFGAVLEADPLGPQRVDGGEDVVGGEGQVLDALAFIFLQIFGDLAEIVLALVERYLDLVVGRGHRAGKQAGLLPLDVEVADLPKVEDALIELRPMVHPAAIHVVGEVIERVQADGIGLARGARCRLEARSVQYLVAELVDEVEVGAADALERRQVELSLGGRRAALDRQPVGFFGVAHPERHGARGWAVGAAELVGVAGRLHVEQEIDLALLVVPDRLGAVGADVGEAQLREQPAHRFGIRAGELDELEAVEAERVFLGGHGGAS